MPSTQNPIRKAGRLKPRSPASKRTTHARKQNGNGAGRRTGRVVNHNGHGPHPAAKGSGVVRPVTGNGNGKSAPVAVTNLSPREQLQHEWDQVLAELNRLRAELLETPELTGDEVDLSVYDREKTLGLVMAFEARLEKLENALQAAAAGKYGICQNCGKPIDPERLKIFPETRHCIQCKILAERQARRGMPSK
ncbi:MAG: TraR/DksA C4-type zinc finger protein [Anaerolineae bacterium]